MPIKSVKSVSHAGNSTEIKHFGSCKLLSYVSDLRVLGGEASEGLVQIHTRAPGLGWRELTHCFFLQHPFTHVPALFKGFDFFSLSSYNSLPFTCPISHPFQHLHPAKENVNSGPLTVDANSSMPVKCSPRLSLPYANSSQLISS